MSDYCRIYTRYNPIDSWEEIFDSTDTGKELTNNKFENIRASVNDSEIRLQVKIEASTEDFALDFLGIVFYYKRVK